MPARQEQTEQQVRWEQFISVVPKDVINAAKITSVEGYTIRFLLKMQFLEQEYGNTLPPVLAEQAQALADSQNIWTALPLRSDVSSEETNVALEQVRSAAQEFSKTKQAISDSQNFQKTHYPQLIASVMENLRLHKRHTGLPFGAEAFLSRSEQEESMELFGDTLITAFDALFGQPETSVPSLPAPIQIATPVEVPSQELSQKVDETMQVHEQVEPEPNFAWKDLGVDSDTGDFQLLNKALRLLTKKLPSEFPERMSTKAIFYKLWEQRQKGDETTVFVWLSDAFSNKHIIDYRQEVTEIHIARILSILLWDGSHGCGWKGPNPEEFREHAKDIQESRAHGLYPVTSNLPDAQPQYASEEQPEETAREIFESGVAPQNQELTVDTNSQPEVRANRFPQSEAEIEIFIRNTLDEFESLIRQKGKSVVWPMNPGQFSNVVENISKRCVDDNKDLVGYGESDNKPYFSKLAFIKLLALEKYQRINAHALSRAFKRFDAIYAAKFQNS